MPNKEELNKRQPLFSDCSTAETVLENENEDTKKVLDRIFKEKKLQNHALFSIIKRNSAWIFVFIEWILLIFGICFLGFFCYHFFGFSVDLSKCNIQGFSGDLQTCSLQECKECAQTQLAKRSKILNDMKHFALSISGWLIIMFHKVGQYIKKPDEDNDL